MSDGMGREPAYLSSHATNRYFIPNWGTICFSSYYNRSPNIKSLDLKYLEAIEKILNFASVTNILQNMKIRISLMGRLANQPIGT